MATNPQGVFEKFDPLEGDSPSYHTGAFDHILFMSRRYLKDKTSEEIEAIYRQSEAIIKESGAVKLAFERLILEAEAIEEGKEMPPPRDRRSHNLLESWNIYKKEKRTLEGVKWSELFAAEALAYVSLSVLDEQEMNPGGGELEDWDLYNVSYQVAMWGFYAMESIGYAAMCYAVEANEANNNDIVDELLKQKLSINNAKAVNVRHSKVNGLKEEFSEFYYGGTFQSRADAARRFYNGLPASKKSLLVETNAVRTLTQSLPKISK